MSRMKNISKEFAIDSITKLKNGTETRPLEECISSYYRFAYGRAVQDVKCVLGRFFACTKIDGFIKSEMLRSLDAIKKDGYLIKMGTIRSRILKSSPELVKELRRKTKERSRVNITDIQDKKNVG